MAFLRYTILQVMIKLLYVAESQIRLYWKVIVQ